MSNCQRMETDLIAYLDGNADPSLRHRVEAHLAQCAGCRQRVGEFRALWGVLDELPGVAPSAAFDAGVRARIAAEPAPGDWWRAWWRSLMPSPRLAFATAALLALSVWVVTIRQAPAPAEAPVEVAAVSTVPQGSEADFRVIQNLPELENYDLLSSFDALSDLPTASPATPARAQAQ